MRSVTGFGSNDGAVEHFGSNIFGLRRASDNSQMYSGNRNPSAHGPSPTMSLEVGFYLLQQREAISEILIWNMPQRFKPASTFSMLR